MFDALLVIVESIIFSLNGGDNGVYTFSEFLAQPFYFFSIFFDGSVIVLNGFLLLLKDRPDRLNPFTDFILVTRGSIEPHYDWVVKMTINANPCPTWV
jgi:hypothetical protein